MAKRTDTGEGRSMAASPPLDASGPAPAQQHPGIAQKAKEQAKNVAHEARQQTRKAADRARSEVQEMVGRRKGQAAARLGLLAQALRETGYRLHEGGQGGDLGRYAERAAGQVERLSSYLRDHDLRGFLLDTEDFARRRPELFLGGTFVAGLALARFLKSSTPERPGFDPAHDYQSATAPRRSAYAPERRRSGPGEVAVGGTTAFNEPIGV